MTSYEPYDYDVALRLTPEEFEDLSGTAFSVSITLGNPRKIKKGMLIIPQSGHDPGNSEMYGAWLWLARASDLPPGTAIHVKILSLCDPMLMPEEESELEKYRGLKLAGVVTHNNKAEAESRSQD